MDFPFHKVPDFSREYVKEVNLINNEEEPVATTQGSHDSFLLTWIVVVIRIELEEIKHCRNKCIYCVANHWHYSFYVGL